MISCHTKDHLINQMKKSIALLAAGVFLLPQLANVASANFSYPFSSTGVLQETGSKKDSSSPGWWVNSGAYMKVGGSYGSTIKGSLESTNRWRVLYNKANPTDTDNGYHPQNIFRLVTKDASYKNLRQEAYFKITRDNLSKSSNRNQSNGLLLFNRYQDGFNLYYTGIRVDGSAVIKKKKGGTYTTLSQKYGIFPGTYSTSNKVSLLPKNEWIGLKSEIKDNADGSVNIKVYMDRGKTGVWKLIAETTDKSDVIVGSGSGGIRTDFMDVTFDDFKLSKI
jgi:hypothetical protein